MNKEHTEPLLHLVLIHQGPGINLALVLTQLKELGSPVLLAQLVSPKVVKEEARALTKRADRGLQN